MGLLKIHRRNITVLLVVMILFAATVFYFFFDSHLEHQQDNVSVVQSRPCGAEPADNKVRLACYWVFLNDAAESRSPRSAKIAVSVIGSSNAEVGREPLVYFPGGPGGGHNSSGESVTMWLEWYQTVALDRPLVLLDYRYLPPSHPHHRCSEYRRFSQALLQHNLTLKEEVKLLQPVMWGCLKEAHESIKTAANPYPLAQISSQGNAKDSQTVMQALGYSAWHILGVSYGTRVALVAALTQPQVRSLILDSPYVFDAGQESDVPRHWQAAVSQYFARCAVNTQCPLKVPNEIKFWHLMADLAEFPVAVHSENWRSQVVQTWVLNDVRLAGVVFNMLYRGGADPRISTLLESVARRDLTSSKTDLEIYYNNLIDSDFYDWVYIATECNDVQSETEESYEARIADLGHWYPMFTGLMSNNVCASELLPFQGLPSLHHLDIPVLVVVGERDPVTPAHRVPSLMPYLNKGLMGVLEGRGHAEFVGDPCGKALIPRFLNAEVHFESGLQSDQHCQWQSYGNDQ